MDLVKIGKYIAGKRKDLGMTQKQLAEKLGMSDKSVSKWERGVCLPDVSVYSELCQILGISINEFLAGEDIVRENIAKKSEENIIGLATDSKQKQKRLKYIIGILLVTAAIVVLTVGIMIFRKNMPQNFIVPVDKDSIEMKTAEMLSGVDGAFMYKYTATNEFKTLYIHIWQYREGKLVDRQSNQTSFELVKAFMGPFKAGFYQTFAALFGASLKKEYDPNGEDKLTERVVILVENGQI